MNSVKVLSLDSIAAIIGRIRIDGVARALGSDFGHFHSKYGIEGICRINERRVDFLAVVSDRPGRGAFLRMVDALKKAADVIAVYEVLNERLTPENIVKPFHLLGGPHGALIDGDRVLFPPQTRLALAHCVAADDREVIVARLVCRHFFAAVEAFHGFFSRKRAARYFLACWVAPDRRLAARIKRAARKRGPVAAFDRGRNAAATRFILPSCIRLGKVGLV